jgi:hypothetical protein
MANTSKLRKYAACGFAALALLAAAKDTKSDLQAKYDGFAAAFAKQDMSFFEANLAQDYILRVGQTTHDRAYVLKDFQKQSAMMKNAVWKRTVTRVVEKDHKATATVKSVFDGDFDMGGKTTHFWNSAVSVDTWMHMPSHQWQMVESRLISLDATLDGKPAGHFPPKKGEKPTTGGH